jgi:hypothetical protein
MYRPTISNNKITGYVVEFSDSDACVECHSGTNVENINNALKFEASSDMFEALTLVEAAFRLAEKSTPANLRRVIESTVRSALTKASFPRN